MTANLQCIQRAQKWGSRTAILSNQKTYTYQQLLESSKNVAAHLLNGLEDLNETRVAFLIGPSFEYTAIQWGVWQAGGIAVPLCVLHPLPSLEYVLKNTKARLLVVDAIYYDLLAPFAKEENIRLLRTEWVLKSTTAVNLPIVREERSAMILYTSGTTNLPKGVVTTHANLNFQIKTLVEAWEWQADDHILNVLPLHHVHGIINVMSCALWVGGCCEFLPKFEANKVWELFQQGNINVFMAVPTIYFKLIHHWEQASETAQKSYSKALKAFRLMVSGSAALPISVLEQWQQISGHTLLERYGMTEIGMGISNPYRGERRAGHIGQALPGIQIRLVNEQGVVASENVSGEIQIKGPNVFQKYWENPEATQKAFSEDGWFLSGDIALLNQGYYKILGRDSVDIIKSGGYKISALEIEDVLRKYPAINDCAVVGLPNPEWGELIVACLILKGESKTTIDLLALHQWLKERLPAYKIPRQFIIQPALPRNVLGKVTKNKLREMF
ncbi:MAG: Long-chain fatty acid--CoA ligase [uncultured Aureispira sp.]|uniref:Long-chain fatty acid--CoA ligase n=1 Tax=uncultured Aureispira sp. TaxID=1331704 RepID=A0A6S6UEI2_9BACT|nr:MAG: Long-chain fatty acid--CoA ligase [uncultured Aureispira sp.]